MIDAAMIEEEAMQLSASQKAHLADRLLESIRPVSSERKASWVRESQERMDHFRRGEIATVDGPEAMSRLREKFAR